MGNVSMEARDINYRGGETKMSVEEALKSTSGEAAAIAALQEAVGNLQTDTGNLQTTKANLITIAPVFSEETAYDPGDLVYNNGLTYRCTNAHEGEWDADDFAATTIDAELKSLNSNFANLNSAVTVLNDRQIVIRLVTSDTIDQATTATLPSGYDCARAVITGYVAKRTNNIWYANDGQVEAGAWANTIYVKPKSADNLECPVDIVLSKFYYDT